MGTAFTPEQEVRIREIIKEELAKTSANLVKQVVTQIQASTQTRKE